MAKLMALNRKVAAALGITLLLPVPQVVGAADLVQATKGGGELYAWSREGRVRLDFGGSGDVDFELPAGANIYNVVATATGWVATGSLPSDGGLDLLILEERAGEREILDAPPGRGRFRGQAVALVDRGQLAGVVWMEGNQQTGLEVRSAVWDGASFAGPEVISPRGPGSQLAPAAAVLDDGSWLVVWSAFDGEDDEIRWSVRREGTWSSPGRLHADNQVPDITPALVGIGGEAMAAWSWFDGRDYRLRTARFDGSNWSAPDTLGAKGSLEPGFTLYSGRVRLLYRTVAPPTWTLVEYDKRGAVFRRAIASGDETDRPLVLEGDGGAVVLRWLRSEAEDRGRERRVPWEIEP